MQADAYKLGYLDAALDFGLTKESWARAIMPLAGAALGAMAAPEDKGWEGAALGGLGALGLQSAFSGHAAPHAPAAPTHPPGGTTVHPSGAPVPTGAIPQRIHETAHEYNVDPHELYARRMQQVAERPAPPPISQATIDASKHYGTDPAMVTAMNAAPGAMQGAPQRYAPGQMSLDLQAPTGPAAPPPVRSAQTTFDFNSPPKPPAAPASSFAPWYSPEGSKGKGKKNKKGGRTSEASLEDFKISVDLSGGVGIPGVAGVNVGLRDQRERLPGMSRWVPRDTIERGFDYTDEGVDPEAIANLESSRGTITHPLLGAALAAAGARHLFPESGLVGPLLSGLVGGGLGTLYNQATKGRRIEEGLEAHSGAQREREKFPIRRHPTQTANESTPLAVSRGSGDA